MEPDRYRISNKLYILAIICLVIGLSLFSFSLYIAPFLLWELNYDVPEVITHLITLFEYKYEYATVISKLLVWMIFFIPSLITGFFAYYFSNRIDTKVYQAEAPENYEKNTPISEEIYRKIRESAGLCFKIVLLMIAIVLIVLLLHAFIGLTI
ncbi:hypothetical protein TUM19329_19060 [Legionella antarctica]|uniref:Transmembrane protein n=1 Tax=Legionella antarctica TaxID=2708020 RepID=A0A6F8T4D5_9GAMM|nr:hypothetical protein [Legionella antarctica]BCA95545.1 hypothetical protein TUM19329_19060 [Legionella antarctica]